MHDIAAIMFPPCHKQIPILELSIQQKTVSGKLIKLQQTKVICFFLFLQIL